QPRPTDQTQPGYRTLDPVAILRVEDRDGNVLYEYDQPQQREILTPQLAYIMNDMLSDRSTRCAAFGCPNLLELPDNRPAAAKIGTTNDFRDGWTVGYTPQLVTGVWVGNSDNSPMQNVSGSTGAAPIWHALMSWALRDEPLDNWLRPSGIVQQPVCNLSGLLPTSSCPTISEIFIDGTQPTIFDNMYQEFAINRETGRLATIYTPPELVDRELFVIYPEAAADWVRDNKIPQPPDEYDTINAPDQQNNNIRITSPIPFAYVQGQLLITGTVRSDNFSFYRLAYFAGLTPNNLQTLADNVTEPRENEELVLWDVSELEGLYTLLLTVVREDGGFEEYSVQVTVDNRPPTVELLSPLPNQQIFTDEEWVTVQARAEDDLLLDRVEFYVDGAERPFAVSTTPPFTQRWAISGPGCNNFQVIAVDAAGNESGGETAVSVCLIERE
ncbi:MAG: hypothetical protein GY805_39625, partial [Chloroflexi bacterium]|nr:hypothetical protein [Chloroflexota bacterium]